MLGINCAERKATAVAAAVEAPIAINFQELGWLDRNGVVGS